MSSWIEVDTFALMHNIKVIRRDTGDIPIWAVVKANAYGHDLKIASEALWRAGVNGWMVTDPEEAKWLSQERYNLPVLITSSVSDSLLTVAIDSRWQLGVGDLGYFERLEHFAAIYRKQIQVQIEIETGMHRTGISPITAEFILAKLQKEKSFIRCTGLYTHLYAAENEVVSTRQVHEMQELQFSLQRKNIDVPPTHVFASDGLALYGADYGFDSARLGKAIYGFCPHFPETSPALTWKTYTLSLSELKPGDTVGYNGIYKAQKTVRTAVLPVGYADGLDRRLSNKGFVLVDGKLCPIIGAISMNHTTIDITGVFKTEAGQEVVLLGKQKGGEITLENISGWGNILDYEFVSRISRHIPRVKRKD